MSIPMDLTVASAMSLLLEKHTDSTITELKKLKEDLPSTKSVSQYQAQKAIKGYHDAHNLVFVLGAGVSMDFGLPGWDTLLQKLILTTIDKEHAVSTVLSTLFTKLFSPSALVAGRYLQRFYEEKKESFEEAVRKVLYQDLDINRPSKLMDEIVNYCAAPGNSPNINSIITYNFDDILEQRLGKVAIDIPFKSIYGVGMNPGAKLPIFHVHGYLPSKGDLDEQHQVTFGESIYHKQYSDIYSWNNIVQINKFRDCNCVFIGSSLTDPNTRRLLDIARVQKGDQNTPHFMFRQNYDAGKIQNRLERLLREETDLVDAKKIASMKLPETVKLLIEIVERFEETDSASFGVKTIWVKKHEDIPEFLKSVRSK